MKQVLFEKLLANDMNMPLKTLQNLTANWVVVMRARIRIGDIPELPRFGKWYTNVRQGKNIYNPYYEEVRHYSARNIVKFRSYLWAGQTLDPDYRPYLSATGTRLYPQCDIASRISVIGNLDLLICNEFVYKLVDRLIFIVVNNDSVSFNNFGTIKHYRNKATNKRNIKYGTLYAVPARDKVKFNASKSLKELVN